MKAIAILFLTLFTITGLIVTFNSLQYEREIKTFNTLSIDTLQQTGKYIIIQETKVIRK